MKAEETCSTCQGTGWTLIERDGVEQVQPCAECRVDLRIKTLVQKAGVPPRYRSRGFQEYSHHHPLQERAHLRAIEFVEQFPRLERGLLFVGRCGVGKTHLAAAILTTLIREKETKARFVDETELLRRLQYSYHPDSPETEKEVLHPLMNAELVVWDDLGTGRPTEWVRETMRTVINYRYTYQKVTLFTTNLPLDAAPRKPARRDGLTAAPISGVETLAERIGQRLFSRVMEMCEIIDIDGPDARTEIFKAGSDFTVRHRPNK